MAKSSKIEDYWRQNNIEGLLKELTHNLAQRMPPDPAAAIVQYLQKKFPKSFKTSIDNNTNMGTISKTMNTSSQSQTIFSPRSDANSDIGNTMDMERRGSNQSQVSGIATIPTAGSAFTDLLKQTTSTTKEAPNINMRNLVFANRLSQKAVRLGKDIRSDHDILEEESIKPSSTTANTASTINTSGSSVPTDPQHAQGHEEPTVKQLIKYKQHIHLENDRRLHREKLAELAKKEHEKDKFLQPDLQTGSTEIQQQQKSPDDPTLPNVAPETSSTKSIHKPIVKSKEEEEILNDETFQPGRQRLRERYRNKLPTARSNSPSGRHQHVRNLASTMRTGYGNSIPTMQFGVCKVCGSIINNEGDQLKQNAQQGSTATTARSFQHQPSAHSETSGGDNVDDWFESASEGSNSREMVSWKPDEVTPRPADTNPFQQIFFQPINDNQSLQRRPPMPPAIITDDETKTRRSTTSRMSESDVFVRTPETAGPRSSISRNIPSPVSKKNPTDSPTSTDRQLPKPTTHLSPSPSIPTIGRRMSGWSVREHSPDDSDEN